ncbi:hypothetical protein MG293_004875 [Ovis ammon polii]|uniref:Uncharacterized protein n=1 Tax=Ovis ammon polii TaxID=230172 RepID=A0AAD4UIX6_OVIAM|nr:hypothetical protein MG293_004875 [Ovis ammon polii]
MQRGDSLPPATVEPGPGTAAHPLLAFPDAAKLHCRVELYQKVVILYAGHNLTGEEEEAEAKGQQEELTPSSRTCRCDGYHGKTEAPGGRECVCVGNSLQSLRRSTLHTDHRYVTQMSVVMLVKHSAQHLECSV